MVTVPALYVLPAALGARLDRFAANGGTLVVTSFTGLADENGRHAARSAGGKRPAESPEGA